MGKNKGFNRQPLNTNKHLGRCAWCCQGYCRCCTNDGCDANKYCSVFCEMQDVAAELKGKGNERTEE